MPFKKISLELTDTMVAATDLSLESVAAAKLGRSLARHRDARFLLVHVVEPISTSAKQAHPELAKAHEKLAADELDLFVKSHDLAEGTESRIAKGDPEEEIIRLANDDGADLIVIGRFGQTGFRRGRIGTIAHRIVRKSPISVLVVPPDKSDNLNTIAAAIDFEPNSEPAVIRGARIAKSFDLDTLHILHAYDLPRGYHTVMSHEDICKRIEQVAASRTESLQKIVDDDRYAKGIKLELHAKTGEAGSVIPELAEQCNADLLLVNTHGRSRAATFMLDRKTETIIDNCTCSVWAEKSPASYQDFLSALSRLIDG